MEFVTIIRSLLGLLFVSGLIIGIALIIKKLGFGYAIAPGGTKRLGVEEVAIIDQKRRLILVRRDDKEHLLLIGGTSDMVIESFEHERPGEVT